MTYARPIAAVHLVLVRDGNILMLRRQNTGYQDGNYSLVAGHVDPGESFAAAMIREAWEEAGFTLQPAELTLAHTMHCRADTDRLHLFFTADGFRGKPVNREPEKCDDLSWFPLHARPSNTVPYVEAALEHVMAGRNYSEFGW